jgi:hypothetical protein
MKTTQLPIWNNRELVGYASSVAGAERLLKRMLTIHPMFELSVWRRPEHLQEILGLPDGFVYAISYTYNKA